MAKVKIQGHASGTGILTVTAPNTSTDRTITLPDSTGTLLTADGDGSSLTGVGVDGISSSADATAITIDSSERVGIGAAPASGIALTISKDGTGADLAGIRLIDSNSGNDQQIYNYQGNLYFRDSTAGVTRLRVDADGLKFGNDTAAANALNDYEEGTFTPVIGGTSESGQSYTDQAGKYTKIGNMVFCHGFVALSTEGTISGFARLKGFPFTLSGGNNSAVTFGYTKQWGLSADHILEGWVYGSNLIYLYEADHQDDNPTQIGSGHVTNTSAFAFSFFFTTTD